MPYRRHLVQAASISGSLTSPCPGSAPRCCCVPWWLEQPSSLHWPALQGCCAHAALSHALEAVQTCFVLELEFPRGLAASAEPRHAALPAAASVRGDAPLVVVPGDSRGAWDGGIVLASKPFPAAGLLPGCAGSGSCAWRLRRALFLIRPNNSTPAFYNLPKVLYPVNPAISEPESQQSRGGLHDLAHPTGSL